MLVLFTNCKDDKPNNPEPKEKEPIITEIAPTTIYAADMFTIKGQHFGAVGIVLLGTIPADIVSWCDTVIQAVKADIEPGTYDVTVRIKDTLTSNKKTLTVLPEDQPLPLQITSVTPTNCEADTEITINGMQFGNTQGTSFVLIGAKQVSVYSSWNDVKIVCKVPDLETAGTHAVKVVVGADTSNPFNINFTVTEPEPEPKITSLSKVVGKVGDTVTIMGSNFGLQSPTSFVKIGAKQATVYPQWLVGSIKFIIPEGATSDSVRVVVGDKTSNGIYFTVETEPEPSPDPVITKLNLEEYSWGSSITITGKNFNSTQGNGKVVVSKNLTITNATQWRDTQIRVIMPQGASSGELYVIRDDGKQSNGYAYYVKIDDTYEMRLIPKGTFTMGDNESDNPAEKPEHTVKISYDFYIALTEVTQKQYKDVLGTNPFQVQNNDFAANLVTFTDAVRFCNRLSEMKGLEPCYTISGNTITCNWDANGYRLPTEAEWEYAARHQSPANNKFGFPSAGNPIHYAYFLQNNAGGTNTKAVKQLLANDAGLYDMNGNAAEWCWNYYSSDYYQLCADEGVVTDPKGPTTSSGNRVVRGGHYMSDLQQIKATARDSFNEHDGGKDSRVGFRFVRKR